jgi:ATP-dependent Lon protease
VSWLPLFPLEVVLFPGGELPLHIFEPRYRKMIGRCIQETIGFGIVCSRGESLAQVGCESTIVQVLRRYPDGRFDILSRGTERIHILQTRDHSDGYLEADVESVEEPPEEADHAVEDKLSEVYRRFASLVGDLPPEPPPRGPRWSFRLADRMRLNTQARQDLLETEGENRRLHTLEGHFEILLPLLAQREQSQQTVRGNGRLPSATAPGPSGPEQEPA